MNVANLVQNGVAIAAAKKIILEIFLPQSERLNGSQQRKEKSELRRQDLS